MEINDNSLGDIFSEALAEIIATVTSIYLENVRSEKDVGFEEITGVMCLCGKKNKMIFISANESDMRVLCSYMIGVPKAGVTKDDIEDALCEFVNMTAGSAKLRLVDTEYTFDLSPPFVIKGKDMSIVTKAKTHIISRTLSHGEISVKLKVIC